MKVVSMVNIKQLIKLEHISNEEQQSNVTWCLLSSSAAQIRHEVWLAQNIALLMHPLILFKKLWWYLSYS